MPIQYDPTEFDALVKGYVEGNRGLVIGSLFMAEIGDIAFFSISSMMMLAYWRRAEPRWTEEKAVIAIAYVLGCGSTILGLCYTYNVFVTTFGTSYIYLFTTTYDPIFLIQLHLARKAFKMYGRNWFLLVWLSLLVAGSIAAALCLFVACKQSGNAILMPSPAVKISQQAFLIFESVTDISITVSIAGYLYTRKAHFVETRRILNRTIWVVMETMLVPPVLALATFITQELQGQTWTRYSCWFYIGKIYLVSLLYSIASRDSLRNGISATTSRQSKRTGYSTKDEQDLTLHDLPYSASTIQAPSDFGSSDRVGVSSTGVVVDVRTHVSYDPTV